MQQDRSFAGIKVSPLTRGAALSVIDSALDNHAAPLTATFLNPDYARRALRNPDLLRDMNTFDLVLVDGNGVRIFTPLFGFTVPARLDTDSFAPELFEILARRRARIYLFGCAPGVAEQAAERLSAAYDGVVVAGVSHGHDDILRGHPGRYADEDSARIVNEINAARADVVLVSLPTPLQQRWVAQTAHHLRARVVMTTGSYVDHLADWDGIAASWYPRWANVLRLNWFYRLTREPRRLWRRYTLEIAEFAALVVRARVFTR